MIEKPILTPHLFSDKENLKEVIRRVRKRFRNNPNPKNKVTVTKAQFNDYFKFTFVRNPWARAFSWYKNVMRDDIYQQNLGVHPKISFKEFLKQHAGKGMLMPQTYWLKNLKGEIDLDFIGRFESLEDDFKEIQKVLNVPDISLPHRIKGSTDDYRDYYDDESIKIISEIYREEISLFDYYFDQK